MAKIIFKRKNKKISVEDNSPIKQACKELGVPFNCEEATCATCSIDILSGEDNLNEPNENEINLGKDRKHRCACQAKIKKGVVEIDF